MEQHNWLILSKVRISKSLEFLASALDSYSSNFLNTAINRSYYSIFHAMRAINALDGFDAAKHSGVIAHFRQFYIKTGVFNSDLSKIITHVSEFRNDSDYNDFYQASKEQALECINFAQFFVSAVVKVLMTHIDLSDLDCSILNHSVVKEENKNSRSAGIKPMSLE